MLYIFVINFFRFYSGDTHSISLSLILLPRQDQRAQFSALLDLRARLRDAAQLPTHQEHLL